VLGLYFPTREAALQNMTSLHISSTRIRMPMTMSIVMSLVRLVVILHWWICLQLFTKPLQQNQVKVNSMNRSNKTHVTPAVAHTNEPSLIDAIGIEVEKMDMEDGAAEAEPDKKPRYFCSEGLPWCNRNYEILSQLMNTLCMSESQAALMLTAVSEPIRFRLKSPFVPVGYRLINWIAPVLSHQVLHQSVKRSVEFLKIPKFGCDHSTKILLFLFP